MAKASGFVVTVTAPDGRPHYDWFAITVSFAMVCPLCGDNIKPNVEHCCSNPKPAARGKKAKR